MVTSTIIKGKDLKGVKLFRLTNEDETHHNFIYKTGKNTDILPFNSDVNNNGCVPGGLYFSDMNSVCVYMNSGDHYIREVTLDDEEDVVMIKEGENDKTVTKYRAHSITLGERMDLRDISTWKYLVEQCVDTHNRDENALRWASYNGHLEVVKYLVEQGGNIHACDDDALICAAENGHLEVVKYLVEQGGNIHACVDSAIRYASENGHLEVVKYLVEQGIDIHARDENALIWASHNGHLEVVKYLVEQGADIHADDDTALRWAFENGHLEVVKYLKSLNK